MVDNANSSEQAHGEPNGVPNNLSSDAEATVKDNTTMEAQLKPCAEAASIDQPDAQKDAPAVNDIKPSGGDVPPEAASLPQHEKQTKKAVKPSKSPSPPPSNDSMTKGQLKDQHKKQTSTKEAIKPAKSPFPPTSHDSLTKWQLEGEPKNVRLAAVSLPQHKIQTSTKKAMKTTISPYQPQSNCSQTKEQLEGEPKIISKESEIKYKEPKIKSKSIDKDTGSSTKQPSKEAMKPASPSPPPLEYSVTKGKLEGEPVMESKEQDVIEGSTHSTKQPLKNVTIANKAKLSDVKLRRTPARINVSDNTALITPTSRKGDLIHPFNIMAEHLVDVPQDNYLNSANESEENGPATVEETIRNKYRYNITLRKKRNKKQKTSPPCASEGENSAAENTESTYVANYKEDLAKIEDDLLLNCAELSDAEDPERISSNYKRLLIEVNLNCFSPEMPDIGDTASIDTYRSTDADHTDRPHRPSEQPKPKGHKIIETLHLIKKVCTLQERLDSRFNALNEAESKKAPSDKHDKREDASTKKKSSSKKSTKKSSESTADRKEDTPENNKPSSINWCKKSSVENKVNKKSSSVLTKKVETKKGSPALNSNKNVSTIKTTSKKPISSDAIQSKTSASDSERKKKAASDSERSKKKSASDLERCNKKSASYTERSNKKSTLDTECKKSASDPKSCNKKSTSDTERSNKKAVSDSEHSNKKTTSNSERNKKAALDQEPSNKKAVAKESKRSKKQADAEKSPNNKMKETSRKAHPANSVAPLSTGNTESHRSPKHSPTANTKPRRQTEERKKKETETDSESSDSSTATSSSSESSSESSAESSSTKKSPPTSSEKQQRHKSQVSAQKQSRKKKSASPEKRSRKRTSKAKGEDSLPPPPVQAKPITEHGKKIRKRLKDESNHFKNKKRQKELLRVKHQHAALLARYEAASTRAKLIKAAKKLKEEDNETPDYIFSLDNHAHELLRRLDRLKELEESVYTDSKVMEEDWSNAHGEPEPELEYLTDDVSEDGSQSTIRSEIVVRMPALNAGGGSNNKTRSSSLETVYSSPAKRTNHHYGRNKSSALANMVENSPYAVRCVSWKEQLLKQLVKRERASSKRDSAYFNQRYRKLPPILQDISCARRRHFQVLRAPPPEPEPEPVPPLNPVKRKKPVTSMESWMSFYHFGLKSVSPELDPADLERKDSERRATLQKFEAA